MKKINDIAKMEREGLSGKMARERGRKGEEGEGQRGEITGAKRPVHMRRRRGR